MKPRFTTPGMIKRAAVNKRIESKPIADNREELIAALKLARHGMTMLGRMMAYDDATEAARQPGQHFRIDLRKEIAAADRALRNAGVMD